MSTAAIAALARLGRSLVSCDWCETTMRTPTNLDGHQVLWVEGRRRGDQFYYVCSPRCRARIKEGKKPRG